MISRDVIFDEKSILERSESIEGSGDVKVNSGDLSEVDGMQSTSTYMGAPIEVELSRRRLTQVEDQHEDPTIQMEVQEQP